jgi:hypothetical protein
LNFVAGERLVAVFACVVETTTFHFDGDDIGGCVVMDTPGLRVYVEPANFERACEYQRSG